MWWASASVPSVPEPSLTPVHPLTCKDTLEALSSLSHCRQGSGFPTHPISLRIPTSTGHRVCYIAGLDSEGLRITRAREGDGGRAEVGRLGERRPEKAHRLLCLVMETPACGSPQQQQQQQHLPPVSSTVRPRLSSGPFSPPHLLLAFLSLPSLCISPPTTFAYFFKM